MLMQTIPSAHRSILGCLSYQAARDVVALDPLLAELVGGHGQGTGFEIAANDLYVSIHQEDRGRVRHECDAICPDRPNLTVRYQLRDRRGETLRVLFLGLGTFDEAGRLECIFGVLYADEPSPVREEGDGLAGEAYGLARELHAMATTRGVPSVAYLAQLLMAEIVEQVPHFDGPRH